MSKNYNRFYFVFASIFLFMTFFPSFSFGWVFKIIPIALLILIIVKEKKNKLNLFILGLVFSLLGDFFLEYDRVNWFIFGLGSFLVAHIFYILAFFPIKKRKNINVVYYLIYGFLMFFIISPGLDDLFIPVLVYMTVLLIMGIITLISDQSNIWLVLGGVSFIVSDSMIGIDKFSTPIPFAAFFIMLTYYTAQYLLVKGFLKKSL